MAGLAEQIPALVVEAVKEAAVRATIGTYRGIGAAPAARRDTGELQAGLGWAVNADPSRRPPPRQSSPPMSAPQVRDALATMKLGDTAVGGVRVPHAVYPPNAGYLDVIIEEVPADMESWQPKGKP